MWNFDNGFTDYILVAESTCQKIYMNTTLGSHLFCQFKCKTKNTQLVDNYHLQKCNLPTTYYTPSSTTSSLPFQVVNSPLSSIATHNLATAWNCDIAFSFTPPNEKLKKWSPPKIRICAWKCGGDLPFTVTKTKKIHFYRFTDLLI